MGGVSRPILHNLLGISLTLSGVVSPLSRRGGYRWRQLQQRREVRSLREREQRRGQCEVEHRPGPSYSFHAVIRTVQCEDISTAHAENEPVKRRGQ